MSTLNAARHMGERAANGIRGKALRFTLLLLAIVLAGGCIQMEHDLQIQGDGSAVYRLNYAITEQAINQFRAMFSLRRDLAMAEGSTPEPDPHPIIMTFLDPSTSTIREQLQPWQTYGVSIRTLRQNTRSLWRDFAIVLDIEDIGRLEEIPFLASHGFSLERNSAGQYIFNRAALVSEPGGIPAQFSDRELEHIRPFLTGFNADVRVEVPGRITSTTAGRTSLQTAIWNFNFDRRPEAMHQLLQQQFHVVFQPPAGLSLPELQMAESP